jgi:hypothetical protein
MNAIELVRSRLRNQFLHEPISDDPADAVRWLGAVQAQDYLGTLWSIGVRTRGATELSIERAIDDRAIVRTWFMRGTLHFVAAEDYRWMIELMGPRMRRLATGIARTNNAELDEAAFVEANEVIAGALSSGGQLTREELARALEEAGIPASALRLSLQLQRAQADGLICYGPRRGKQVTHVLVDDWLPTVRSLGRDEAIAALTKRYFQSHGPATVDDFAWWSGLPLADVRAGIASLGESFACAEADGRTYWMPAAEPATRGASQTAHLLWGFDEYVVAYKDRSAPFSDGNIERAKALGGGMLRPVVVVGGRVVGNWRRKIGTRGVTVEIDYFEHTSAHDRRAIAEAAEEYARFLGRPVTITGRPV